MAEPSYKSAQPDASQQIIDLSKYLRPLEAYEDISDLLSDEDEQRLVSYVKALVEMSHSRISKRYDHWKEADRAHDVYVKPDTTAFREKAVIGDTRAIADTVVTYLMAALTGRNPMFQLEGLNGKSRKPALLLERVLHQQMRRTAGEARIAQQLLDGVRYGFAPTKVVWHAGLNQNLLVNCNPRMTFPDPRPGWGRWEDMAYVVTSDFTSIPTLLRSNLYPKLAKYPGLQKASNRQHSWAGHQHMAEEGRGLSINPSLDESGSTRFQVGDSHVIDECWFVVSGHEVGLPGAQLIWLTATVLDEKYIIRFQLSSTGRQFPFVFGSLYHDVHKTFGQSLYDLLLPLHDIATWLLRSRIDNVQAALNNLVFVDPTQVNVPDLIDRNPWGIVRTLPGVKPGDGVFIAEVPDVTRGHWNDIMALSDLKQRLSAASDAQQGVPTSDVRSATEIARLTQLGSQRLGVLSRIMSASTIRPMAQMMVANIQDAIVEDLSKPMASIPISDQAPSSLVAMAQDGYIDASIQDLQGQIDYLVIDGTLPVEPQRNAETWMNVLQVLNQTGLAMEYKIGQLAEEAIRALGVPDLERFRISKEELSQNGLTPSQQLLLMEKQRGQSVQAPNSQNAQVMPDDQVAREVERGNLVPSRSAA